MREIVRIVLAIVVVLGITFAINGKRIFTMIWPTEHQGKVLSPLMFSKSFEGKKISTSFMGDDTFGTSLSPQGLYALLLVSDDCRVCSEQAALLSEEYNTVADFGMPVRAFLFSEDQSHIKRNEYQYPVIILDKSRLPREIPILPALLIMQNEHVVRAFIGSPYFHREYLRNFLTTL